MMTDKKLVTVKDGIEYGCVLSACETFRYVLWRIWDDSKPLWMFVLLNPSTANHEQDDPTITRQMRRARDAGAGGIVVVNTGAIRETNSDLAVSAKDPMGPHNVFWIKEMIPKCEKHIAGWGPKASKFKGDVLVKSIFRDAGVPLYALHVNKDGSPKHPLYIAYDAPLVEFFTETNTNG